MEDILASIKKVIAEEKEFRQSAPPGPGEDDEVLELDSSMEQPPEAEAEGAEASSAPPPAAGDEDEVLLAEEAAGTSRARLDQLAGIAAERPEAAAGNPLEDMIREMLRPVLKAWLDEKLPGIVDEHVRREISRITGRKL